MDHEESILQAEMVQHLQKQGIYFFSVPNEAAGKDKLRTMRMMGMGMRPGVADMVLVMPGGKVVFVEVKKPDGKQSDSQKKFECKVLSLGHLYYIVRSITDLDTALQDAQTRLYSKHHG